MASHEIRNRPSNQTPSGSNIYDEMKGLLTTPKGRDDGDFRLLCPFSFPPGPEAAAVRLIQNVAYFWMFYTLILLFGLSISLIPERKLSLLLLIATSAVTCSYLLLLRLLPASAVLHRVVDRRLVVMLMAIVAIVELILTEAGIHLGVTLAIGTPIIMVHAVLRARDDLFFKEEAYNPGELLFLVERNPKVKDQSMPSSTDEV